LASKSIGAGNRRWSQCSIGIVVGRQKRRGSRRPFPAFRCWNPRSAGYAIEFSSLDSTQRFS
jgi:hypothetical protein